MVKVWHISDVHLSMNDEMKPIKKMNERRWAIGTWTFTGYLEAIQEFAKNNISENDITFITGDITHDMYGKPVYNSLTWLRDTIPGHIVICRGNHDKDWKVGGMKFQTGFSKFHIIGEGEITQLGQFTIGCYSDHSLKTHYVEGYDETYIKFAESIAVKAKTAGAKIPVMISHYPVSAETAEAIGKTGVKAYMSGHIHCTGNEAGSENGLDWGWYNKSAAQTDDKYFKECFFSTGTIDVLRAKHGQPFKEIECLRQHLVPNNDIDRYKDAAAKFFNCSLKSVDRFNKADPFNKNNTVSGFLCREKGLIQGSLFITHVNGIPVTPQTVFGTSKLAYPYVNTNTKEYKDFSKAAYFALTEKWNGMNVLFYKYFDANGVLFITAKSKGTPFLTDSDVGNFLSLTKEVIERGKHNEIRILLHDPKISAISLELCGNKEPHLVKYDFDIDLKPLFMIRDDGEIRLFIKNDTSVHGNSEHTNIAAICEDNQKRDLEVNIRYRQMNGLPHKYEYEHFAVEGKVLYLLDENLNVIDRTLYKIKPEDIEEVHWQTFNSTLQGRVREALLKIKAEGLQVSEETIRSELDMDPKEWDKFSRPIMLYVSKGETNTAKMAVLVGLPGSGKSTLAKKLEENGYIRINQDDMGSRNACKKAAIEALKLHKNIVIDRCNFDKNQRRSWFGIAREFCVTDVKAYVLDVGADVCIQRASTRVDHPTISGADEAIKVINGIKDKFSIPDMDEGFVSVKVYKDDISTDDIVKDVLNDG